MGNGDGTFRAVLNPPQMITSRIVAADFNGDGKLDLAAIGGTPGNTLAVLLGNGDGTFAAPSTLPTEANFNALGLAVGDFNGDGKPDIAETVSSTTPGGPNYVSFFWGNGDGTFAARLDVAPSEDLLAEDLASLAAADFTGNGSSDLSIFGSLFLANLTISTATLDAGLPGGVNVFQADYAGDANNAPSNSTNKPQIFVTQQPFSLTSTLIGAATGCGNGMKAANPPPSPGAPPSNPVAPPANPGNPGTTPGAYTVIVTGSSGSITAATAVSVAVN